MGKVDTNNNLALALDNRGAFLIAALFRQGALSPASGRIDADEILHGLGLSAQPSLNAQALALQTACESSFNGYEVQRE